MDASYKGNRGKLLALMMICLVDAAVVALLWALSVPSGLLHALVVSVLAITLFGAPFLRINR
jgi:hypothetical protein